MAKTNLKEAEALIKVEGILSEKGIEETTVDGKKQIKGDLVIQTSDTNFTTFSVFVNEYKSDGKGGFTSEKNGTYAGIKTVLEDYKSIAKDGKEAASRIRVTKGQIRPNTYINKQGARQDGIRYNSTFFNRLKDSEELNPHAEFELELFISSIKPEQAKNEDQVLEETGRVLVKGWMPTYNGIECITLVAPQEDGIAEAITDSYERGQTVEFSGDVVSTREEKIEIIPVKIGKPKEKRTVTYKNELVITGASEPYEEGVFRVPYDADVIEAAVVERETKLAEAEAKAKSGESSNKGAQQQTGKAKPVAGRNLTF